MSRRVEMHYRAGFKCRREWGTEEGGATNP